MHIEGSVAYCSQTSFVINGSLKENILFGLPFEVHSCLSSSNAVLIDFAFCFDRVQPPQEDRYRDSLRIACMEDDLLQLRDADETIIGEKGVNLSGGQKQRVRCDIVPVRTRVHICR